jgi:hypothetical protein
MGWACEVDYEELGKVRCLRTWKYSEYDRLLECLQVRYTNAMAMAMTMAMISSERKPPSMLLSQDETHAMIGDFTEMTMSNYDDDLCLVRVTSAKLNGRMPDIPDVEIWRTMLLCMFLLSLSLLHNSLLLWISAQYKWRRHGFLPPPEISQVEVEFPRAPDPPNGYHMVLIGCGTYGFVRLRTLNCCLIVSIPFLLLYKIMQPRWFAPKEGDNVMSQLYVTCPGPCNTRFI